MKKYERTTNFKQRVRGLRNPSLLFPRCNYSCAYSVFLIRWFMYKDGFSLRHPLGNGAFRGAFFSVGGARSLIQNKIQLQRTCPEDSLMILVNCRYLEQSLWFFKHDEKSLGIDICACRVSKMDGMEINSFRLSTTPVYRFITIYYLWQGPG